MNEPNDTAFREAPIPTEPPPIRWVKGVTPSRMAVPGVPKPASESLPPVRTVAGVIADAGGAGLYLAGKARKGVLSPWPLVNTATGGLHSGELVIVAAGTGKGKSDFAINYSLQAASKGKTGVAFFSLEMSFPEMADRIICLANDIDRTRLKANELDLDEFDDAVAAVAELPIHIVDCSHLTLDSLQLSLIKLREKVDIGMVVCDYLQLMSSTKRYENRTQEITALSRGLKLAAKEAGLPFLVMSQLTRSSGREKRPPELYDLRDSGSIEIDANVVMFLHGQREYKERPDKFVPVDLIIAKQRSGISGQKIAMEFRSSVGRFVEKL